ncbi:hypothetical protein [uncultured Photobacterium sp.]|uniref:hypothetical protein n=1 Tax=uncultured Photobacterium sp. TaxID=173973 RepID=UPI00261C0ECA|nr:hypothetical protein [uncultured Photobacterium sp.]
MKLVYFALLAALPATANNPPNIQLLDQGVAVEVKSSNNSYFDETVIWQVLEGKGWKAAQDAAKDKPISDKLTEEIQYQSQLAALNTAMKSRNRSAASELLNKHPKWASCQRIQWAWLDLQHETRTGFGPNAQKKYRNIVNNCPQYSLSTTKKIMSWAPRSAKTQILALYRQSPGFKTADYSMLAYQLHLEQLAGNNKDTAIKKLVAKQAKNIKCPEGSELLAWQYLQDKDFSASLTWFDRAINWSRKPSQKLIEGKLLSLKGLERTDEYERFYNQWVKRYPKLKKQTPDAHSQLLASTCKSQPVACLKLLEKQPTLTPVQHSLAGWQWYNLQRPLTAKHSFEKALQGLPAGSEQHQNALYGYSLSLNRAGFQRQAETLASQLVNQEHKEMYAKQQASQAILNAYEHHNYQYVIEKSNLYEQQFGPEIGLTEIKGWAHYNQKQNTEAVQTFQHLVDAYPHDTKFRDALKTAQCAQKKSYKICH